MPVNKSKLAKFLELAGGVLLLLYFGSSAGNPATQSNPGTPKPLPRLYKEGAIHAGLFAVLGIIAFGASVLFLYTGLGISDTKVKKDLSQCLLAVWTLGPPIWFFYEYFHYFPKHRNPDVGYDALKAAQEVTAKLWVACSVTLFAIYSSLGCA
jgi:hypothetical protein